MITSEIIQEAYYLAGILDPQELIEGYYLQTGLFTLNDIVNDWSSVGSFITFDNTLEFMLSAAKSSYILSLDPLIADVIGNPITNIVTCHVLINTTKYPVYPAFSQADNIQNYQVVSGVPATVYQYDQEGHTEFRFYPTPSQNMLATLLVKQRLGELTAFDTLIDIVPRARAAFVYELAFRLANKFQYQLSGDFKTKYADIIIRFEGANVKDSPVNRDAGLTQQNVWNWWAPTGMV